MRGFFLEKLNDVKNETLDTHVTIQACITFIFRCGVFEHLERENKPIAFMGHTSVREASELHNKHKINLPYHDLQ